MSEENQLLIKTAVIFGGNKDVAITENMTCLQKLMLLLGEITTYILLIMWTSCTFNSWKMMIPKKNKH